MPKHLLDIWVKWMKEMGKLHFQFNHYSPVYYDNDAIKSIVKTI